MQEVAANDLSVLNQAFTDLLLAANLEDPARKKLLTSFLQENWGKLPIFSTLKKPLVEEVQKVTVGSGVLPVFRGEDGRMKILLAQAGPHYKAAIDKVLYTIPGGFINLTETPGSSLVPASDQPENPRIAGARETEEELQSDEGALFSIDPDRLTPMDTNVLTLPWGEKRLVLGMMLELAAAEVTRGQQHIARLAVDADYKAACAEKTINEETGLPEVIGAEAFDLADAAAGNCPLLHEDQRSLFQIVSKHFTDNQRVAIRREGPTRSFRNKVMTLERLKEQVEELRREKNTYIGVTSGVFDLVHPGHISFLEDASRQCSHLIVIVASDRTVREQKGDEKPYINELKRAQTLAGLETVDAVIISDEMYHETILQVLRPDVMFKGDDYAGKQIIGAELVGEVVLIPCAEKEFNSSSNFVRMIKEGQPDTPPAWAEPHP